MQSFKTLFPFNMFSNGIPYNLVVAFMFTCMFYRYLMDVRMDKGAICLTGLHLLLVSSYANISETNFMFYEIMILFTLTSTYEMFITVINNGKKIKDLINYSRLTGPNANTRHNTGQPKEAPGESKAPEEAPRESKAPGESKENGKAHV